MEFDDIPDKYFLFLEHQLKQVQAEAS